MTSSTANKKVAEKAETPLKQVTPQWAQEFILKQMFYRYLGARPEDEAQLREAYSKRFSGKKMRELLPHEKMNAVYLEGPPGHGKTTVQKAAAKEFAKLMNKKFYAEVTQKMLMDGKIDKDCVVFEVIELAGETSNKEVFGLMAKVKINGMEFMGHLPDWRLAATMMAGYGYVLYDDFATATHQVQNSTLGLLLSGTAGDLKMTVNEMSGASIKMKDGQLEIDVAAGHEPRENSSTVHFGLAGNRGTRDGNKTFPITTAVATRVWRFDVEDTPDLYCDRIIAMNNDALGDCQMTGLIQQNEALFSALAKQEKGMMGQMPVPRTWDMLLTALRTEIGENGGVAEIVRAGDEKIAEVLYDMEVMAAGAVGKDGAAAVGAYYNALFLGAAPVADAIIRKGEVDVELIRQKYNGGNTAEGQNFGISLATSLASFATEDITQIIGRDPKKTKPSEIADLEGKKAKDIRKVIEHFSYGIAQFTNMSTATFAVNQLLRRLAVSCPVLFTGSGEFNVITEPAAMLMATGMFVDNQKYVNQDAIETVANSLSTYSSVFEGALQKEVGAQINAVLKKK